MKARKATTTTEPAMLREREAAEFLGVQPRTLQAWRLRGEGPRYCKLGSGKMSPVRYPRAALEAFVSENLRQTA